MHKLRIKYLYLSKSVYNVYEYRLIRVPSLPYPDDDTYPPTVKNQRLNSQVGIARNLWEVMTVNELYGQLLPAFLPESIINPYYRAKELVAVDSPQYQDE